MASGGYRQPGKPAATSGPGALSQRTDGGAGSRKQPLRVPTGGKYGEAKALEEQEKAAPMAAGGPGPQGHASSVSAPASNPQDMFRPTEMPGQSIMTGVSDMQAQPPNAKELIRLVYQQYPSPWIASLLSD